MGAEPTTDERPISEAERLLWLTDQLAAITEPTTLRYAFSRASRLEDGFDDVVELEITDVHPDGMKTAVVTFLTGDRNVYVPPHEATRGNPVLGVYLQGDVYEMNRLTEGNWRYFHRKVKRALAESAEITDVRVQFRGREVPARRVRITPYAFDEKRDQFDEWADKVYEITVSDEVPGYLYEIHTLVPGRAEDGSSTATPVVEETLRLIEVGRG